MSKFPVDAPNRKVVKTLESLGFSLAREGNHTAMQRKQSKKGSRLVSCFLGRLELITLKQMPHSFVSLIKHLC